MVERDLLDLDDQIRLIEDVDQQNNDQDRNLYMDDHNLDDNGECNGDECNLILNRIRGTWQIS